MHAIGKWAIIKKIKLNKKRWSFFLNGVFAYLSYAMGGRVIIAKSDESTWCSLKKRGFYAKRKQKMLHIFCFCLPFLCHWPENSNYQFCILCENA